MVKREYRHNGRVHTVTLSFPLPEEAQPFEEAYYGGRYKAAIETFLEQSIRRRLKYEQHSAKTDALLETLRAELLAECEGLPLAR